MARFSCGNARWHLFRRGRPECATYAPPRLHRARPGGATIGRLEYAWRATPRLHRARPGGATIGRLYAHGITKSPPMLDSIYTADNVRLAYELRWSVAVFWSHSAPSPTTWLKPLQDVTEPDGVRILEHRFTK